VPAERAEIIAGEGNFHGRTIAIVSFSSVPQYRKGFGPFPPGFKLVPFGDAAALEAAITPYTAAFLIEPIQGEGGINVPPAGYLAQAARICRARNVLLICDEIQTGLGRTGRLLACEHDGVRPDGVTLGKALGGGLIPVSLFLARREVMDVFEPGDHGSTFGGNPIAAAVGLAALDTLVQERLVERAAALGPHLLSGLAGIKNPLVCEVRGRGLFAGIELDAKKIKASVIVGRLLRVGILTKEAHRNTIRLAPPLIIKKSQIDWAVDRIARVLGEVVEDIGVPPPAH
jgi:ornithine--oxo-acid transaminase